MGTKRSKARRSTPRQDLHAIPADRSADPKAVRGAGDASRAREEAVRPGEPAPLPRARGERVEPAPSRPGSWGDEHAILYFG